MQAWTVATPWKCRAAERTRKAHKGGKGKTMKHYELTPADGRKSFYGKAIERVAANGDSVCRSYTTDVCGIIGGEFVRFWDGWSATTARHIDAYRTGHGLPKLSKKEWLATPVSRFPWIEFDLLDGGKIAAK